MSGKRFQTLGYWNIILSSRKFVADQETFNWFKSFKIAEEEVVQTHEGLFNHVDKKMDRN